VAFSSTKTRSATPIPNAAPDPPSLITGATIGVRAHFLFAQIDGDRFRDVSFFGFHPIAVTMKERPIKIRHAQSHQTLLSFNHNQTAANCAFFG
jgi:hypothetical protein